MSSDIDALAAFAYRSGTDPLDWALYMVKTAIEVHVTVATGRAENPTSFPAYCLPLTIDGLGNSIIGILLDAGWTPPEVGRVGNVG
jgi:hypothetical protein